MRARASIVAALLFALLSGAPAAQAQEQDDATLSAARMLGYSGIEAYHAGDYGRASERLERSFQLLRVPSLGLWSARALLRLGKLIEAHERYAIVAGLSDSIGDAPVQRAARLDAQREGAELWPRIPRLTIEVDGARADDVVVTLDGAALSRNRLALPLPVNPGQHVLLGSREEQRRELTLSLVEGQHERAVLRFKPSEHGRSEAVILYSPGAISSGEPKPTSDVWTTVGWIGVVAGTAGLATGVFTYFNGKTQYDQLSSECRAGWYCYRGEADNYEVIRTVHTVSTIGGLLVAGAGVAVLIAARDTDEDVALSVGPGQASFTARF